MNTGRSLASSIADMNSYADADQPPSGAMSSALQSYGLAQPLEALFLRSYFLNRIFGVELDNSAMQATDNGYESFFKRYAQLCKLAANINREVESVNHWQMASIITILRDRVLTRDSFFKITSSMMRESLTEDSKEKSMDDLCTRLTDVAIGMWLMVIVTRLPGDVSYDEPIIWPPYESQEALLRRQFSPEYHSEDSVKLPQTFTAAHLEQIAGIEVVWTSNLADHLLLKDDDTKLMLFHQASILGRHLLSNSSTLPRMLVDETVRSISLLIPPVLGEPNPWFKQQQLKCPVDASAGTCERLNSSDRQIDNFLYWRDRLVLLKRTFDDAEPRKISQLWFDDRKKTQWFTFWVAVLVFIMTVFFGVIQSVAGIVQAWASVQSLKAQNAPSPSSS